MKCITISIYLIHRIREVYITTDPCKRTREKTLIPILGNNLNLDIFKILSFYAWLNMISEQKQPRNRFSNRTEDKCIE